MTKITILGSLNYDVVTITSKIPNAGETLNAQSFETHHGGKGANQALATRRLSPSDIHVQMIGAVGDDTFGHDIVNSMAHEGVNMTHVRKVTGKPTGVATIIVDPTTGENRIMVFDGANGTLSEDLITPRLFEDSDYLILQNEAPLSVVYKALETAHKAGVKVVYNPSPVCPDTPASVFNNVDYLVVNSSEAQVLGQCQDINDNVDSAKAVIHTISERLGCPNVIITLGANGAVYKTSDGSSGHVPACKVEKIVDTTGAGDTFLGATTAQLAQGIAVDAALKFAARASAVAVTRPGAAEGIPHLHELD